MVVCPVEFFATRESAAIVQHRNSPRVPSWAGKDKNKIRDSLSPRQIQYVHFQQNCIFSQETADKIIALMIESVSVVQNGLHDFRKAI